MYGQSHVIYNEQLYRWLKFGDMKGEIESTTMTVQDQAISTNYIKKKTWRKRLTANAGYVNNMKKVLTT